MEDGKMLNLRKWFFDFTYRFSTPPWDSNVTPPEVVALVTSGGIAGRALDLGCGTGTNSIYLAQHGFAVVGVDFSPKAIATARAKARRAGVAVEFHVSDVTRLDFLREPFDLVLAIGCFHSLGAAQRAQYAEMAARLTRAGGVFLLYAFSPRPAGERGHLIRLRSVGVLPTEVQRIFGQRFTLTRIEHGSDHGERASAWYWFSRQ